MMNLPYKIKVAVIAGSSYHSQIVGTAELWAELVTDKYRRGDQVVHIAGGRRLHPGVYTGNMTPIVKISDLPAGVEVTPLPKLPVAYLKFDSDVGDFYLEVKDEKRLIYGGFSRFSAQRWARENGYQVVQTV